MKPHRLACVLVVSVVLGSGAAWAGSVTGSGSGPTNKEGCDVAKANATSQLPAGAKVKKFSQCLCQGHGQRKCSISAEF